MESAGASIIQESLPHTANVAVHVLFGTFVLLFGLIQLARTKGDTRHVRVGRWFLVSVWGAVATAAVGVTVFRFSAFLSLITLLVAYWAFSGYRALRIRMTGPTVRDAIGAVVALLTAGLFVVYLHEVRFPWSPVVIYSTLATLITVALYDLVRFAFPTRWFATLGLYEHLTKMIGAFGAGLSAFSGTVFGGWQPYSQLVPSVVCTAMMVGFILRVRMLQPRRSAAVARVGAASSLH